MEKKFLGFLSWFTRFKFKRGLKHFGQRLSRGWDDSDTWNLERVIAAFIIPRLEKFREVTIAHPIDLTPEQWDEVLGKMIFSFRYTLTRFDEGWVDEPEMHEKYKEGMRLFAEYFDGLWW